MKLASGIRAVALLEAAKGAVVLLGGFGLLALIHRDVQAFAEAWVGRLHLNPARHLPRIFLDAAAHVDDSHLRTLAFLAALYSSIRFVESYGLWRQRRWAEWIAVVSGGIYLPFELVELARGITLWKVIALTVNLLVVLFMAYSLWRTDNHRKN